jgi:hypothetical protein
MSSISEVYGNTFQETSIREKGLYAVKLYASNIGHKQFNFRNDTPELWSGNNIKSEFIQAFQSAVRHSNAKMRIVHMNKFNPVEMNVFPYLIKGPVEYFILVDMTPEHKTQLYSFYITPFNMDAF